LKSSIEDIDLKMQTIERQEKKLKEKLQESQEKLKDIMPQQKENIGQGG
jgi:chaperonin cofactor prefoldin